MFIVWSHLGNYLGGGRNRDERCHVFCNISEWDGLLGITGSWSNSRCDLAAANEREKGFCPILPSLYHSGTPTYLSLPFCLISCFFLFVGHIGRTLEWGGHIWRWFLKRCWLSRPGRECLLSPSQASGVTVAAMTCLSCGSVFGINGPSSLVLQWVTADVAIVNWEMALYGCDIAA